MSSEFVIRSLTQSLIRKTFPFASAFGIESLAEWEDLATRLNGVPPDPGKAGVVVAEAPNGVVTGLFAYRADDTAIHGPILVCDPFWVCNLPRCATPLAALLGEAERISWRIGTKSISITLTADGDPIGAEPTGCEAVLFRAGYVLDRVAFRKRNGIRPLVAPRSGAAATG